MEKIYKPETEDAGKVDCGNTASLSGIDENRTS